MRQHHEIDGFTESHDLRILYRSVYFVFYDFGVGIWFDTNEILVGRIKKNYRWI